MAVVATGSGLCVPRLEDEFEQQMQRTATKMMHRHNPASALPTAMPIIAPAAEVEMMVQGYTYTSCPRCLTCNTMKGHPPLTFGSISYVRSKFTGAPPLCYLLCG